MNILDKLIGVVRFVYRSGGWTYNDEKHATALHGYINGYTKLKPSEVRGKILRAHSRLNVLSVHRPLPFPDRGKPYILYEYHPGRFIREDQALKNFYREMSDAVPEFPVKRPWADKTKSYGFPKKAVPPAPPKPRVRYKLQLRHIRFHDIRDGKIVRAVNYYYYQ